MAVQSGSSSMCRGEEETQKDAGEGFWLLPEDLPACGGCLCAAGDSSSLSDESLLPLSEAWLFKVLTTAFSGCPALAAWLRLGTGLGCSDNLLTKNKHRPRNAVLVQVLFRSLSAVSAQAGFCFTLTELLLTLTPALVCYEWKGLQSLPGLSCCRYIPLHLAISF